MIWPDKTYVGQWRSGKPHGQGVMFRADGADRWIYTGQFEQGCCHGLGRCEWPDLGLWYDGEWHSGTQNGIGQSGSVAADTLGPFLWRWNNGRRHESLAKSLVGREDSSALIHVVLNRGENSKHHPVGYPHGASFNCSAAHSFASDCDSHKDSISDPLEVQVAAEQWGFAIGEPDSWLPRQWGALIITRIYKGGALDRWNEEQRRSHGPKAVIVFPNAWVLCVNGLRDNVRSMATIIRGTGQDAQLVLELCNPPHVHFSDDALRDGTGGNWTLPRLPSEPQLPLPENGELVVSDVSADCDQYFTLVPFDASEASSLPSLVRAPKAPKPPASLVAQLHRHPVGSSPLSDVDGNRSRGPPPPFLAFATPPSPRGGDRGGMCASMCDSSPDSTACKRPLDVVAFAGS